MGNLDFSFLRLLPSFDLAKSDKMTDTTKFYNFGVCLHPQEHYLQITNSEVSIAFDDSYKVDIVDCNNEVLKDVTENVFINEFQDINGIYQLAFEVVNINEDFYGKTVYFKFTQTSNTDNVYYSNGVKITADYIKDTFRLDYKSYSYYEGISYDRANFYQNIRLFGYFNLPNAKEDNKNYTKIGGNVTRARITQNTEYNYNIDLLDTFTFERLQRALNSDIVYLNSYAFNNTESLAVGDRKDKTNLFDANFKGVFDYTDSYDDVYQIASSFKLINTTPEGLYTLATLPSFLVLTFNKNITLLSGEIKLIDLSDNSVLNTITTGGVSLNEFVNISFTTAITTNGNYKITISDSMFSGMGQFLPYTEIFFTVSDGDYLNTDYSTDYFIN